MTPPSSYITQAVRILQRHSMKDCVMHLTACGVSAEVIRVTVCNKGEETVSDFGVTEAEKVLAVVADLPTLNKGALVELDDDKRIVTSIRLDCTRSSCYIGLTPSLNSFNACLRGVRGNRRLELPLSILATNGGKQTEYTDGYAPIEVYGWTVAISSEDWPEATAPQVGDEIIFDEQRAKISKVTLTDGVFICHARSRQ